jgi:YVTN family beta-propeller protein
MLNTVKKTFHTAEVIANLAFSTLRLISTSHNNHRSMCILETVCRAKYRKTGMFTITSAVMSILLIQSMALAESGFKPVVSPDVIFEALALNRDIATPNKPKYLSPADMVASPDKSKLYVAEQTAKQIAVISISGNTVIQTIKLPNEVTGIVVSKDGSKLYATITSEISPEGYVCVINAASGKIERKIKVGHSPRSPVVSPDGNNLYICNQFNNDISVVDIASGREIKRINVIREPYCARITPDGNMLVVANYLPLANATDTAAAHCKISLIDLDDNTKTVHINLTQGSHEASGVAITPDGKYALITHLVAMFNLPATQIIGGRVHTNNLAILDIENKKLLNDISVDRYDKIGLSNPWGIGCTPDGKFTVVAHAGCNELSIIDQEQILNAANTIEWLGHKVNLLYADTIRKRVNVRGKNPRAVAIVGNKVYTSGYFSNTVEVFDISLSTSEPSSIISLGPEQPFTDERKGEYHFYNGDEYHCQGAWQSCHSCHSFTRSGALDWMLAAGVTMQKNTKSLLYAWYTPLMNWSAKRHDCAESIKYGIIQELGMSAQDSVTAPMGEFIKRLKPLPSPHLKKGCLSESAARGRMVFYGDKTDCKLCHPAPLFTDKTMHTSIVADMWDGSPNFDTPQLQESWRSAPWDHIGTTLDFEALLKNPLHSNCASKLSEGEFKDLMEYVLSL